MEAGAQVKQEETLLSAPAPRVALAMACLFASLGMALPFLSRWLSVERGLAGAEIGAVLSLAQLARIATGPLIAVWADEAADRRTPIRVLGIGAVAAYGVFFFLAHDFRTLLASGFVALTLSQACAPFVEAAVLRATAKGRMSYGVARGLGSISFIIANIIGGVLIARFGLGAVVAWVLGGLACFALSAWLGLKPDPAPHGGLKEPNGARFANAMGLLRRRRYLLVIIACGLIQAGHAFYYGFSTLTWRAQGISPETVGFLWACGVAVEVLFFWSLPLIEPRTRPEILILIGGTGGAVRWFLMGLAPTGWVLWPIQAMHALSFAAAHVGAMRLIFREAPERSHGLAQTLYAALSGGLFLGLSTLSSGLLYDWVGARGYWAMAALAGVGTLLAAPLLAHEERKTPPLSEPRP